LITTKVLRDKFSTKFVSAAAAELGALPWFARQFDCQAPPEKAGWPKIAASQAANRWVLP